MAADGLYNQNALGLHHGRHRFIKHVWVVVGCKSVREKITSATGQKLMNEYEFSFLGTK